MSICFFSFWLALSQPSISLAQESFSSDVEQGLQTLGVLPTREGLKAYFDSYAPDSKSKTRVAKLIGQLGSDSFDERTNATTELAKINLTDLPLVQKATQSEDLEVSLRAKQVIKMFEKGTHLRRLGQILKLMERHEIKGFVKELCLTLQVTQPSSLLKNQFERTIARTATESDTEFLTEQIRDKSLGHREVFVRVLAKDESEKHADLFAELMADSVDDVVLAAAMGLARITDRRCLDPLVKLMGNDSIRIRSRANQILRMVTGKRFGFIAVADKDVRQKAIDKWLNWNKEEGAEAILVKDFIPTKNYLNRLIVASYTQKQVFETDLDGEVLRTFKDVGAPMGVGALDDGTVLICDYTGKQVLLFGPDSKVIFRKKLTAGPLGAEVLENGNVLVGASSSKQIFEFDREGKTVWTATVPSRVNVVHRTPDNTTLVSMLGAGKVVELDETGKTIFDIEVHKPNGVRRLENGNTLVCLYDKGEVHEYNPDKVVVWKISGLTKPARAQRMPDGNTIIYHRKGVEVFDSAQKKVKQIEIPELKNDAVGSMFFF